MGEDGLLGASRREAVLYRDLLAAYRALAVTLGTEPAPVDLARVSGQQARAEAVTGELRAVAATLAPHRLTGAAVSAEVQALWRTSAHLAAEAAALNSVLAERARRQRARVSAEMARLDVGRRGLTAYRPGAAKRPALAAARV
jgi:hypothetical protein